MVKIPKGVVTTEFWLSALAVVLPFAGPLLEPQLSAWATRSFAGALVAGVYTASRSWLKRRQLEADAVAARAEEAAARAAAESRASARAGEAAGVPPRPTGGNVGTPASSSATIAQEPADPAAAPGGASSSVPPSSRW